MGVETALAIGAGSSVLGSILNYGEQRAARRRGEKNQDAALALTQNDGIDKLIMGMFSKPNVGQDGFLQMLRADPSALKPYQFDASQMFKDLQANDKYTIGDQVNQLRAGAGSLGARFGSGFAAHEAGLRGRFAANIGARNAGISQQSFRDALQFGQSGYATGQQSQNNLLSLLLQSRGQKLGALGFASQPLQGTAQGVAQGGVDIAQLLMLAKAFGGSATTGNAFGGYNPVTSTYGGR